MEFYENMKRIIVSGNDFSAANDLLLIASDDKTDKVNQEAIRWLSSYLENFIATKTGPDVEKAFYLHEEVLKSAAIFDFESYMLFTEWNRDYNKQFYRPRRKQLKIVCDALQELEDNPELKLLAISMPPGTGKALANDTPILTRNGWKNHGDLVVGDEVIGMNGEFKKVIAVHPKCMLDRLVTFANGEQIQCHARHEWEFFDRTSGTTKLKETQEWEKRSLETGGETGHRGHRYILQLPHRSYVQGEHKELPLDPYTLGVWLGDGANKNPRICCAEKDRAVIDRIVRNGMPIRWQTVHKTTGVLYFDFNMRTELQALGMCHSRKITPKHIPQDYLTASVEQRLELLAGLLDTDGCLSGEKYQFTTVEEELRDTFVQLVSTFGWRCSVLRYDTDTSSSGIKSNNPYYVVAFTPDIPVPCELPRKRNHGRPQRRIAVVSIDQVEPKEGNCITVEGDGMYLAGYTMLPTHNTTMALFYLTWLAGKYPNLGNLTGSHNGDFIKGCYEECLNMIAPNSEYRWTELFPNVKLTKTDAHACRIDLDERQPKRETLQFTTIGSGNAGLYRALKLLYCDDLISGSEVAMNKEQLDKLWNVYTTDLQQRMLGDKVKELHIATRWSVADIIGRLENLYGDEKSNNAKFIAMPAWDENENSLWDYKDAPGYSTAKLHQIRDSMNDVDWNCLYMNQPYEREGLLYPPEELREYYELPKDDNGEIREPDAIIGVCDTKDTGKDYAFLPVAYVYGEDYYIEDCVCDNGLPKVVDVRLAEILLKHKVSSCRFESNSSGGKTAEKVQKIVNERKGITHITTKYSTSNKITKIITNSDWVMNHCLFKSRDCYKVNSDYGRMMKFLTSFTVSGKNPHDDVPDGMAQLALFAQSFGKNVTIIQRPW